MSYVFISHSSKDQRQIRQKILSLLEANGIATWYSTDDIKTTQEWHDKIVSALDNCDWFLVAISPNAIESTWVPNEVHRAFAQKRHRIIPVLLKPCDSGKLHLGFSRIQHIDLTQDIESGQAKLLELLRVKVPRPVPPKKRLYVRAALLLVAMALVGLMVWQFWPPRSTAINLSTQSSAGVNANATKTNITNQTTNSQTMPTGKLTPREERIKPTDEQANNSNANQR